MINNLLRHTAAKHLIKFLEPIAAARVSDPEPGLTVGSELRECILFYMKSRMYMKLLENAKRLFLKMKFFYIFYHKLFS